MSVRVRLSECLRDGVCNVHFYIVLHRPKRVLAAHRFRQCLHPGRVVRLTGHKERSLSHAHTSAVCRLRRAKLRFITLPIFFLRLKILIALLDQPSCRRRLALRRLALRRLALPGGHGGGLDS